MTSSDPDYLKRVLESLAKELKERPNWPLVKYFQFEVPCTLEWKLVFDYHNTGDSKITRTFTKTVSKRWSTKTHSSTITRDIRREAEKLQVEVGVEATYEGVSAKFSTGFEASTEVEHFVEKNLSADEETTVEETISDVHVCKFPKQRHTYASTHSPCIDEIGPYARLELYQLHFIGPGTSYACDVFVNDSRDDRTITQITKVKPLCFIKNLRVSANLF
jgi:hypothetical protein